MNRIGQQFGNYHLVNFLGQGGFAEVYLGRHIHMGSFAAIKILNAQFIATDSQRFLQEARLLVDLKHPHIVSVLECGIENDIPYLVMDYAPSGTLRQRHPVGTRVPLTQVVSYVLQVADALQYAHDRRLIHRDVKPENMLLGRDGEVLLSDFGIAVISASSSVRYTKDSAGTAIYMAPEQIDRQAQRASDQYALGIVTYEWLCGGVPFQGSFGEITARHLHAQPPSFREKNVNIPPAIEGIVMRALAKRPEERFLSVKEFALALQSSSPQQMTSGSQRDSSRDGSLILADTGRPSPFTDHPVVQRQPPTPANTPPLERATPHITRRIEPSTQRVPPPQVAPTIYNAPYAPTQPAVQYSQPRRTKAPYLVAVLVSLVLLLGISIGAIFVVPKINLASIFSPGTTGSGGSSPTDNPITGTVGGSSPTDIPTTVTVGGSSPTSVPANITVYPHTLMATNGSSTTACTYSDASFGPDSGWDCGITLQNNGQNMVNWRAAAPPEVGFRPDSTGFLDAGSNWILYVHVPLKDCPGSVTITITPDGGTPQDVVWTCS